MWGLPASFGIYPHIPTGAAAYVNSVQHIEITIPTGAASATATISAVGSKAFILFLGFNATSTTNASIAYARVELTDATTVTAYRNSSSGTEDVTVSCVVVDATSSLVSSVQSGTVSIASDSTSGTATINSTNANYTVVHYLGLTNASASTQILSQIKAALTLSGTTVTATRINSNAAETVGFIVIEFQAAACNQAVQGYQKSWTTGTSTTQAITSVDTGKAILIYAGCNASVTGNEGQAEQYASLTNSTTVTINVNTSSSNAKNYNFFVVEFASGVLQGSVQRGTTTLTSVNSNTSGVSGVDTSKAALNFTHYTASQSSSNIPNCVTRAALTNSTTVTVYRSGSSNSVTGSWELAEFN